MSRRNFNRKMLNDANLSKNPDFEGLSNEDKYNIRKEQYQSIDDHYNEDIEISPLGERRPFRTPIRTSSAPFIESDRGHGGSRSRKKRHRKKQKSRKNKRRGKRR